MLGHKLEDLINPATKEEEGWEKLDAGIREVGGLMRTNKAEGPFVLGERPSYTDFLIAGALQAARVVDERTWERLVGFEGQGDVYRACEAWMGRRG